ncbi:hypothetical protein KFL_000500360 [Klebsormidium nitens]|uniref:Fungal lipase-type domain-containing protein n=1 Tax=Klebsormidium nitens TaxID=105231 RepID=A0A1Y1HQC6_KLENI|nr:hypothetical protein KFL_000500360 [Klebsormidium nitens]|eukprot:GAQ80283.1 hypothetical protein KFL_000500360 [Klebsormidium nitens]
MTSSAAQLGKASGFYLSLKSCDLNKGNKHGGGLQQSGVVRGNVLTPASFLGGRSTRLFLKPAVVAPHRSCSARCVADAPPKRTKEALSSAKDEVSQTWQSSEPALLPLPAVGIPSSLKFLWFNGDQKDRSAANVLNRVSSITGDRVKHTKSSRVSIGSFDEVDPGYLSDDEGVCWVDGGEGLYGCSASSMSPFETPQVTSTTPEELYDASEQLKKGELLPLPPAPQKNSWIPQHLMGLHTMWRGLRGSLRQGSVGAEEAVVEEKVEQEKDVKIEQPQKKANVWAMAALLNWQKEEADKEEAARKAKGCGECPQGEEGEDVCCLDGQPPRGALAEVPRVQVAHDKESFAPFLQKASVQELRTVALLSKMCDLAYYIPLLSDGDLFRQYRLRLHTTSLEVKAHATRQQLKEMEAAKESASERDRQATAKLADAVLSYVASTPSTAYALAAAAANSAVSYIPSSFQPFGVKSSEPEKPSASLLDNSSEMNASEIIIQHDSPHAEISGAGEDEPPSVLDFSETNAIIGGATEQGKAESALTSADESALTSAAESPATMEGEAAAESAETEPVPMCPCEWFIADDMSSRTRYFVIQGSDSLASWQTNFSFEPVPFEDPALGIMVHRGIYDAAKGLYAQLLPFVKQHMKDNNGHTPRLRFAGHSLGGSLAIMMSLMMQIRGDIPKDAVLPVHTFGAPSIMCGGDHLLGELGLALNHVVNVVMHRDIVPRAFACDYPDSVVEVLRRMGGGFKDHACLKNLNLLFAPMGVMMVLQPDQDQAPYHPLLPAGGALYQIRHPRIKPQENKERRREKLTEVRSAQRALLNTPHPLEILSDPRAYGNDGTISRDHDPRNYTKALNAILRQESRRQRRRLRAERRVQGWAPLVGTRATEKEAGVSETVPVRGGVAGLAMVGSKRGGKWEQEREVVELGRQRSGGVRSQTLRERSRRYLDLLKAKAMRVGAAQSS